MDNILSLTVFISVLSEINYFVSNSKIINGFIDYKLNREYNMRTTEEKVNFLSW